jgi:transcriptional regulator GlxA family with amidase domain
VQASAPVRREGGDALGRGHRFLHPRRPCAHVPAAGLLAHRPATTHWSSLEMLAQLDSTIEVRTDERFVDDGDVVTSAGISAGIDMALHLVSRLAGVDRAREVRRGIRYDPAPPI